MTTSWAPWINTQRIQVTMNCLNPCWMRIVKMNTKRTRIYEGNFAGSTRRNGPNESSRAFQPTEWLPGRDAAVDRAVVELGNVTKRARSRAESRPARLSRARSPEHGKRSEHVVPAAGTNLLQVNSPWPTAIVGLESQ